MRSISCFEACSIFLLLSLLLISNSNTFVAAQRGDSRTPQQNEGGDDIASIILYSVFGTGFIIFVVSLLVYAYYCKDQDETTQNETDNSPTSDDADDEDNEEQQDSSKKKKQQQQQQQMKKKSSSNSHSASDDNNNNTNNNNNCDLQEVVSNANTHDPTADTSFVSSGGLPPSEGCREDSEHN